MKIPRIVVAAVALALLSACGGGGGPDPLPPQQLFLVDIESDPAVDGDVDSAGVVTVGAGSVLTGVDPLTPAIEQRGFFSFPLGSVPLDADVQAASLELFVVDLVPAAQTPFVIDLVSFGAPLIAADFSTVTLPTILSRPFTFLPADIGRRVVIDVTPLAREASLRGFADAQFRLRLAPNLAVGLLEIDDPVATATTVPLLHLEFF